MSLFDVIRYPISNPPTTEEIDALPCDLFMMWLNKTRSYGWISAYIENMSDDKSRVSAYYKDRINSVHYVRDIGILRKLIQEYDT